jgi:histone H3/H4
MSLKQTHNKSDQELKRRQMFAPQKTVELQAPVTREDATENLQALQHGLLILNLLSPSRFLAFQGHSVTPIFDGTCPECFWRMREELILDNFSTDILDFRTCCVNCSHKFFTTGELKTLKLAPSEGKARFIALRADQTKDQFEAFLAEYEEQPPHQQVIQELAIVRPELAWNAYWHGHSKFEPENDTIGAVIQFFLLGTVPEIKEEVPYNPLSDPNDIVLDEELQQDVIQVELDGEEHRGPKIQPLIRKKAVRKIAKRGGIPRVAKETDSHLQDMTTDFVENLLENASLLMAHRKGKTLKPKDLDLAMSIRRRHW